MIIMNTLETLKWMGFDDNECKILIESKINLKSYGYKIDKLTDIKEKVDTLIDKRKDKMKDKEYDKLMKTIMNKLQKIDFIKFKNKQDIIKNSNIFDRKQNDNRNREFWIWFAGFFDGEGTIGMYNRGKDIGPISLSLVNTNENSMKYIKHYIHKSYISYYPKIKHYKKIYRFGITNRDVIMNILYNIKDYSIVKRKHIELVLNFMNHVKKGERNKSCKIELRNSLSKLNT